MKKLALLALVLAGCETSTARYAPDRLDLSPYYGEGHLQRVGSPNRADSEQWGLMITLGWDLNADRTTAYRNLSRLEVNRSGALTLDDDVGGTNVNVDVKTPEGSEDGSDGSLPVDLPDAPETVEEGLAILLWALGIAVVLLAIRFAWKHESRKASS